MFLPCLNIFQINKWINSPPPTPIHWIRHWCVCQWREAWAPTQILSLKCCLNYSVWCRTKTGRSFDRCCVTNKLAISKTMSVIMDHFWTLWDHGSAFLSLAPPPVFIWVDIYWTAEKSYENLLGYNLTLIISLSF